MKKALSKSDEITSNLPVTNLPTYASVVLCGTIHCSKRDPSSKCQRQTSR
ncbi:Uncharacterised protein [Vibrio cholerae]|nr:Uncharacterised protein [Vibrio cholerae]